MFEKQINNFLDYLSYEKKYSSNTIRAYSKDLNDFIAFIQKNQLILW